MSIQARAIWLKNTLLLEKTGAIPVFIKYIDKNKVGLMNQAPTTEQCKVGLMNQAPTTEQCNVGLMNQIPTLRKTLLG